MASASLNAEERFATIVAALRGNVDVTPPAAAAASNNRFGSAGLKVRDKVFTMLVRDRLVVKLPKARVDAFIASGGGERYDPRRDGRRMKEWVMVSPSSGLEWLALADEAMAFVGAQSDRER